MQTPKVRQLLLIARNSSLFPQQALLMRVHILLNDVFATPKQVPGSMCLARRTRFRAEAICKARVRAASNSILSRVNLASVFEHSRRRFSSACIATFNSLWNSELIPVVSFDRSS